MNKFTVRFLREFEVEIQAESGDMAAQIASSIMCQVAPGKCKLLSIIREGAAIEVLAEIGGEGRTPPRGRPNGGGSSGGTIVKVPVLVDQVAA